MSAFLPGANLPWINYGYDFHKLQPEVLAEAGRSFAEMADAGMRVVRWFGWCDGRGGPLDNAAVVAALDLAEQHGLMMDFVLLDYLWCVEHVELPLPGTFVPLLQAIGKHPALLAVELMNEPELVIDKQETHKKGKRPVPLDEFAFFARAVGDSVRALTEASFTIGSLKLKHARQWLDFLDPASDFVQVHFWDESDLPKTAADSICAEMPVIWGEFAAADWRKNCEAAERNGYSGAWLWSWRGVDKYGAPDKAALGNYFRAIQARNNPSGSTSSQ